MILKATLEDQINVSNGNHGGHAALARSWSTDGGQWQAINGAGHKAGFQQLSTVVTCTCKPQSPRHTFACSSLHSQLALPFAGTISYNRAMPLQGSSVRTAGPLSGQGGYKVII